MPAVLVLRHAPIEDSVGAFQPIGVGVPKLGHAETAHLLLVLKAEDKVAGWTLRNMLDCFDRPEERVHGSPLVEAAPRQDDVAQLRLRTDRLRGHDLGPEGVGTPVGFVDRHDVVHAIVHQRLRTGTVRAKFAVDNGMAAESCQVYVAGPQTTQVVGHHLCALLHTLARI